MVQIALYAGLGFFLALLLALIVSPLLRRRTIRLTERRMRAELPQSMEEIRADRDSVRAEYAMRLRQSEIKLEKLEDAAVDRTMQMEARNEEIYTLKTEIRQKLEIIAEMHDDLENLRSLSFEKDEELARTKSKMRELSSHLDRKMKELERSEARYAAMDATVEKQRTELIAMRATLYDAQRLTANTAGAAKAGDPAAARFATDRPDTDDNRKDPPLTNRPRSDMMFEEHLDEGNGTVDLRFQVTELEAAKLAVELRAKTTEDQLASVKGQITTLEERLAELQSAGGSGDALFEDEGARARIFDMEAQISALESELAAKEARIAKLMNDPELAEPGDADSETVAALRARLLEAEAEKAGFEAEVTRLTFDLEMAVAQSAASLGPADAGRDESERRKLEEDKAAAEAERDQALARADELRRDYDELLARQETERKAEQAEIAHLRESLSDLAADVTHIVMTLEGEDSPVDKILSATNGLDGAPGQVISLADRIKTLRARSAPPL